MRPGRKTWWLLLMLMLVLPTSLWRSGADEPSVRVIVREPAATACVDGASGIDVAHPCGTANADSPDMEKPGLSRAD
jgi:hypothetical protein